MLHKSFGLDVKSVGDEGIIEGYASVFGGKPDSYGDIIAAGAFTKSLERHTKEGTMPLMLWGHDSFSPPIGNWTEMSEDRKGLWVQGQVDLEDAMGSRVHRALKRKALKGLSIGYETLGSEADPKRADVRTLTEIELWEVSPVNFPAQRRAAIENVKSYTGGGKLPSLKEFEELLREAGFSNSEAKAITGKGFSHLLQREAGTANDTDELLRKLRESFC